MTKKFQYNLVILLVVLLNYAADRGTKMLAEAYLAGKGTVEVVGNFFILHLAHNQGAFLSMGSTMGSSARFLILAIIPAILLIGGLFILCKQSTALDWFHRIVWASLIGGGFANIYDRLFNEGRVIDFMNFGIGNLRTGILNVADLSITFGAIAIVLAGMRKKKAPESGTDHEVL